MDRHEIYCSKGFLDILYAHLDKPLRDFLEESGGVQSLYKMIHHRTDLILDIDDEQFKLVCNENPNFKKLMKSETVNVVTYPQTFRQMDEDENYFTNRAKEYYFLEKSPKICHSLEEQYGLIFISKDEMELNSGFLFNSDIEQTTKKDYPKDWTFIQKYRHPFNALIITDGFLLDRSIEDIEINLVQFLYNFLPEKLEKAGDFDLLIVTKKVEATQRKYDYIKKRLSEFFSYQFNFSLIQTNESSLKIHDRNLMTNYLWISSGNTFSIFKKNPGNNKTNCYIDTILSILPRSYINSKFKAYGESPESKDISEKKVLSVYNEILENIKIVVNKSREAESRLKLIGSGKNRLLD